MIPVYDAKVSRRPNRIEAIIRSACARHGVTRSEMLRGNRGKQHVSARRDVCRSIREAYGASLPYIGHMVNLHHTSVLHLLGGKADELPIAFDPNAPDLSGEWI